MKILTDSKSGLILITSLWILVLISLLSLGLAHRVTINSKLVKFQKDRLMSLYVAKAGIQKAASVLADDSTQDTDTLNELWSRGYDAQVEGGDYVFKDIEVGQGSFTISYIFDDTDKESPVYFYGMSDEDRKININSANSDLLVALFELLEYDDPESLADAIIYWRGDSQESDDSYYESQEIPYSARKAPFRTIEELSLVKGFRGNWDLIEECEGFLSIYPDPDSININTATHTTLKAVFMGLRANSEFSDRLANNAIDFRDGNDNEQGTDDDVAINQEGQEGIKAALKIDLNETEETWVDDQAFPFTVNSSWFRIDVSVELSLSKIQKEVSAIVFQGQGQSQIKYWHEE